jgi:hypothetical protein
LGSVKVKRRRTRYDPDRGPNGSWWSSLEEEEQIQLVLEHHRRAGVQLPNAKLHAATHVIVENQVLLGDQIPVACTLERLRREGLSRHEAVHAIGTVLAPLVFDILKGEIRSSPSIVYYQELRALSADRWLSGSS